MQDHLLQNEIEPKEKQVEFQRDKISTALQQLSASVGWLDLQCLKYLASKWVLNKRCAS